MANEKVQQVAQEGGRPRHYRGRAAAESLRERSQLSAAQRLHQVTRGNPSWDAWCSFLKGVEGQRLSKQERTTWYRHASLPPREGGFPEAVCLVGRRAGKSTVAAVLAVNAALNARPPAHAEQHVIAMAQTEINARRVLFAIAQSITEQNSALSGRLTTQPTRGELSFDTGTRLITTAQCASNLRGYASPLIVLDELGFYGPEESIEAVRAARPCLATVPGSRLVVISSPGPSVGALFEMCEKPGQDTVIWRADAPSMNPGLPRDYLERLKADDPIGYRQEVLAEFVSGVSTLLDPAKIETCTRSGHELKPKADTRYVAFVDPSGGRHDSMTLAIGHLEDESAVIDLVRRIEPPFSPADVVAEFASVCREYGVHKVTGDGYASALHADLWTDQGLQYQPCKFNRSQLYLSLVGPINQERVRMPRQPGILHQELRQLQRRKTRVGRESVDHPRSGSDDAANAVAGAVFLLLKRRPNPMAQWHRMLDMEKSHVAV